MNVYIGGPVEYSDMQGPAPSGFHVPLYSEWQAIINTGVSLGAWSSSNGVNLATYLKLPMAGYRDYNDLGLYGRTSHGHYWSSTPYNTKNAYYLFFDSSSIYQDYYSRSYGYSVRCVKNSPTIPTASWNVLYQGSGSAGIFHNPTDGLISISSDGSTWYTLMDKNLGATTVYNYGDTLTEANCGKIYQWGNNYGFSGDPYYNTSLISQSSTQVNVTGYGPGNYYSSSTWIINNPRQSSANNGNNLRGGVSQGSWTKSVEVKNIYIGEYISLTFGYTGSDQNYTIPHDGIYKITAKGAGSRTAAGGLGEGVFYLTEGTVLSIMVGANGGNGNGVKYGFGGSANGGSNAAGGGLSGVFTGGGAITASDSDRALVIGGGAGGSSAGTGGAGGGETGGTGTGRYGTAGAGGTQTGRGSDGNAGASQFNGGNGSRTYGYGGGGGWRGGNGSIGDGSGDDDRGGGGGSGYVLSTASSRVLTQGGGSAAGHNGVVTIVKIG